MHESRSALTLQLRQHLSRSPLVLANTHHSSYRGLRASGSFLFAPNSPRVARLAHLPACSRAANPSHRISGGSAKHAQCRRAAAATRRLNATRTHPPSYEGGKRKGGRYRCRGVLRWCQLVAAKPLCASFPLADFFGPIFRRFNSDRV